MTKFKYEHTTLESAHAALERMVEDAKADGFDADNDVDVVYGLLLNLEMDCPPKVRKELWRVELGLDGPLVGTPALERPNVHEEWAAERRLISDRARRIAEANRERAKNRRKL